MIRVPRGSIVEVTENDVLAADDNNPAEPNREPGAERARTQHGVWVVRAQFFAYRHHAGFLNSCSNELDQKYGFTGSAADDPTGAGSRLVGTSSWAATIDLPHDRQE